MSEHRLIHAHKVNAMQHHQTGKILKLKQGYNPNSSSIGSQIPAFLFFALGTGAVTVIVTQLFSSISSKIRQNVDAADTEEPK